DFTGHVLLHTVHEQCLKRGVKFYSEWYALELIVEDNVCRGLVVLDVLTGELHTMYAKAVMFATGGYGRAYKITSNAFANTGDGARAVPPPRDLRARHPDERGLPRRGRLPAQQCGRALHGALRARPQGAGPA